MGAWASADFFPGVEAKTYYICLKSTKKDTIFFKKSQKTYYFARPKGGKSSLLPSLRTPMDGRGIKLCKELRYPWQFDLPLLIENMNLIFLYYYLFFSE